MRIFFYGLFMDESLLANKGVKPARAHLGFLEGYELRIGERATLIPRPGSRAYGVVMDIAHADVTRLYSESSVADYLPVPVIVDLTDGTQVRATCYILPARKVTGTNKAYAGSLLEIAAKLEFPDTYLEEIRKSKA